jgi:hypothetical protein
MGDSAYKIGKTLGIDIKSARKYVAELAVD